MHNFCISWKTFNLKCHFFCDIFPFLTDYNPVFNHQVSHFILTYLFLPIYKMWMLCKTNAFICSPLVMEVLYTCFDFFFPPLFVSKTHMQNACFEPALLQRTHNHSKLSILLLIYHCLCFVLHRLGHVLTHSGGISSFQHVGEEGE